MFFPLGIKNGKGHYPWHLPWQGGFAFEQILKLLLSQLLKTIPDELVFCKSMQNLGKCVHLF